MTAHAKFMAEWRNKLAVNSGKAGEPRVMPSQALSNTPSVSPAVKDSCGTVTRLGESAAGAARERDSGNGVDRQFSTAAGITGEESSTSSSPAISLQLERVDWEGFFDELIAQVDKVAERSKS